MAPASDTVCKLVAGFFFLAGLSARAQNAPEVVTEAKVLQADSAGLAQLGVRLPRSSAAHINGLGFVLNISESVARSLAAAPGTKTLQTFQLAVTNDTPAQFRIASRVTANTLSEEPSQALDAGIDFQVTSKISSKREIWLRIASQVRIRRAPENPIETPPLFSGQWLRQDIQTADGATVVLGGFISEADASRLTGIGVLKESPILKHLFAIEDNDSAAIILVLTPHILNAPDFVAEMPQPMKKTPAPATPRAKAASDVEYAVQVGAFKNEANARILASELSKRYPDVFIQIISGVASWYRVRVGHAANIQAAQELQAQLRREGFEPFIAP